MPRITGPTIAEHVAAQEAAVVAAARRLFAQRGVSAVTLADIAAEVGLGRTSLYRYFPTKAHILQRWFDLEMTALLDRSAAVMATPGTPLERLTGWLDLQLEFMTDEAHGALVAATATPDTLPEEVLADVGRRHGELYATLTPVLRAGGARGATVRARALMIAGLLRSAGELVGAGTPRSVVRRELVRSAAAVAGL